MHRWKRYCLFVEVIFSKDHARPDLNIFLPFSLVLFYCSVSSLSDSVLVGSANNRVSMHSDSQLL